MKKLLFKFRPNPLGFKFGEPGEEIIDETFINQMIEVTDNMPEGKDKEDSRLLIENVKTHLGDFFSVEEVTIQ